MYIGINFWYKQGYQIFYFPLDKYYDRAAKKIVPRSQLQKLP